MHKIRGTVGGRWHWHMYVLRSAPDASTLSLQAIRSVGRRQTRRTRVSDERCCAVERRGDPEDLRSAAGQTGAAAEDIDGSAAVTLQAPLAAWREDRAPGAFAATNGPGKAAGAGAPHCEPPPGLVGGAADMPQTVAPTGPAARWRVA